MNIITQILQVTNPSLEDLVKCLDEIRKEGNVVVLKFDGGRINKPYTVFITFSTEEREIIREDSDNLKDVLIKCLKEYLLPKI